MTTEQQMAQEIIDDQAIPPEEPEATEPEQPEPLTVDIGNGVRVDIKPEELGPYVRFKKWADAHPDLWDGFVGVENGTHQLLPRQEERQAPPEPEDFEDPAKLADLYNRVTAHEQQLQREAAYRSQDAITQGATRFKSRHDELTDDEMNQVMTTAAEYELVIPLSKRLPPADAVDQALEIAYRNIAWESRGDQVARDTVRGIQDRKRAVRAIGSSKASSSRAPSEPTTSEERREAMVQEIAQAMGEQSSG